MFTKLTLTNFKSVEHDSIDLSQGLNVFRGNSEAGKTTRIDAILYALFGVSALKVSLEELVRYDQPVASLKVLLEMLIDGVTYTISRGKSGAEIRYGDQSVTGQTETKLFIERLLGVDAKLAAKLLFANQTDIRGVLEDGPTAAAALIETLANLGQIEVIVDKIQAQLPCGNLTTLSGQITDATADLAGPEPLPPSEEAKNAANAHLTSLVSEAERLQTSLGTLAAEAAIARESLAERARIEASNAAIQKRMDALQLVTSPEAPEDPEDVLVSLRAAQADSALQERKYKSSQKSFEVVKAYAGTRDEFFTAKETLAAKIKQTRENINEMRLQAASIKALRANETTCGFCKKDLSSVPEVVENNKIAAEKLAELDAAIVTALTLEGEMQDLSKSYAEAEAVDRNNQKLADEFWQASDHMPAGYFWVGGEAVAPGVDVGPQIVAIEKAWKAYRSEVARYEAAQVELATLAFTPVPPEGRWQVVLDALAEAEKIVKGVEMQVGQARVKLAEAEGEYNVQLHAYNSALKDRERAAERLKVLKAQLTETAANNELVKKLRAARPIIANKLWVSVLGAVGHYFSQIRGNRSIISKDESGFKCDGHSVAGLSGSTKDSLGLALRLALVKTFVPTASFISLDEPASGCDAQRELAMLGVVAGAGFDQTLLVTHSDLADSFANKVLQL